MMSWRPTATWSRRPGAGEEVAEVLADGDAEVPVQGRTTPLDVGRAASGVETPGSRRRGMPALLTAFAGTDLIQSEVLNHAFGLAGLMIAPLFVVGAAEFIGPFEPHGWKASGALVPIAYIGWSIWLLTVGIGLIVTA